MDAEKQDAINVFLGHFQPQQDKPALWELDSDQHYNIGRRGFSDEHGRSFIKRSFSDGNVLSQSNTPSFSSIAEQKKLPYSALSDRMHQGGDAKGLSESTPEISTCESDISYCGFAPTMLRRQLFPENVHRIDDSNFLDLDWLSSSGNSCEEEIYDRSALINTPIENLSTENVNDITAETSSLVSESGSSVKGKETAAAELSYNVAENNELSEFSDSFVHWVINGDSLCF